MHLKRVLVVEMNQSSVISRKYYVHHSGLNYTLSTETFIENISKSASYTHEYYSIKKKFALSIPKYKKKFKRKNNYYYYTSNSFHVFYFDINN